MTNLFAYIDIMPIADFMAYLFSFLSGVMVTLYLWGERG